MNGRFGDVQLTLAWHIATLEIQRPPYKYFDAALKLAAEIAEAAPLAVESTRATLRMDLADAVERQLQREFAEQRRLARAEDHRKGMRAVSERRPGNFDRR